jgi:hypothetical protein
LNHEEFYNPERIRGLNRTELREFFLEHAQSLPERRRRNLVRISNMRRVARGLDPIP